MSRLMYTAMLLSVFLIQGCATHFHDRLPIKPLATETTEKRTGIPITVTTAYAGTEYNASIHEDEYEMRHWVPLDRYIHQGLGNAGYAVVGTDEPHVIALDISCERDLRNPGPAFMAEGGFIGMLMAVPYAFAGGPLSMDGQQSCDVEFLRDGQQVLEKDYFESFTSRATFSPVGFLYMPFQGVFGADHAFSYRKLQEVFAAKLVTNVAHDANKLTETTKSDRDGGAPVVVQFPES